MAKMNFFTMHVGNPGNVDLDYTVSRACAIDGILKSLSSDAPERTFFASKPFLDAFPAGTFNCWGVPERALPTFEKTKIGDVVLFIPEIGANGAVEFIGQVKAICRVRGYQASRLLWPSTPDDRLFPWLFFFDTERCYVPWERFLDEMGYKENWNPRGYYRTLAASHLERWGGPQGYLRRLRGQYAASKQ
jgi:hypothetical protein